MPKIKAMAAAPFDKKKKGTENDLIAALKREKKLRDYSPLLWKIKK